MLKSSEILVIETSVLAKTLLNQQKTAISFDLVGGGNI